MDQLKNKWKAFLVTFLDPNDDFWKRWGAFFKICFDPWGIILTLVAFIFILLQLIPSSPVIISLLTILISITTGLLGGVIAKRWDDYIEKQVVKTQGLQAINSLNLLSLRINTLKSRVRVYLQRHIDQNYSQMMSDEVINTYLEEIIEKCGSLEEEIIKAIEDWKGILPEADITSNIEDIIKLIREQREKVDKYQEVKLKIETNDITTENLKKFTVQLDKLRIDLDELDRNIQNKKNQVSPPLKLTVDDLINKVTKVRVTKDDEGNWKIIEHNPPSP
jgi:hypothetical protein